MAEWSNAAVLKTVVPQGTGGSNPSLSAIFHLFGSKARSDSQDMSQANVSGIVPGFNGVGILMQLWRAIFLGITLSVLLSGCGSSSSASEAVSAPGPECKPARIMPLGDSITQANTVLASYRRPLWIKLQGAPFKSDFVGSTRSNHNGPNPYQDFDLDHEGHWGWTANEVISMLNIWAAAARPNIALIHLGTNDLHAGQGADGVVFELRQIVGILRKQRPNIGIALAAIIPSSGLDVSGFNSKVKAAATQLDSPGSPVVSVDMQAGFSIATHSWDGVHPNAAGENFMAERWYPAIIKLAQKSAAVVCG